MSLETNLLDLATRIGTECKSLRVLINGNQATLAALTTTDKSTLVAAINELADLIATASGIDDTGTALDSSWSSQKTYDELIAMRDSILGGAGPAYDTLAEIQAMLQGDDVDIATITTALANRLRIDAAQGLTSPQKQFGRDNLDVYSKAEIGDVATDFVATFEAGLV